MSAPDRVEVHRGPCLCGGGEIVVDECSPDNPWSSYTEWLETSIQCPTCKAAYALEVRGRDVVAVKKSDLAALEAVTRSTYARGKALMATSAVLGILADLEAVVNAARSVAAKYRFLRQGGLVSGSEPTFRKSWRTSAEWIKRFASYHNLRAIMNLLGESDPAVESELAAIKELTAKAAVPAPPVGPPLFHWKSGLS